jgi:GT2 family glycosyltransferase
MNGMMTEFRMSKADKSSTGNFTVVIPVHNAADALEQCLDSVARTLEPGTGVLVVDDASSDPAIRPLIDHWVQKGGTDWQAVFMEENLGFVAAANHGMRQTSRDVILLNSDTEVTHGWLDGLRRCLDSDSGIATATPWTNNGEIASLPLFCKSNPVPPDPQSVARVIAQTGNPGYPDLPTAVGFCMAISRGAIEQLGLFNQEKFGMGYGEENDFSMRAHKAGMRNVLCDDVYIIHLGGVSFGPRGLKPGEESMKRLLSIHPDYLENVQTFIEADPLKSRRDELINALRNAGLVIG